MNTTSVSLLERLRSPGQQEAWNRFVRLYTPLLLQWCQRLGMREADAADLMQDVFTILVQKMGGFRYNADMSFRAWLKTVLLNRWRNLCESRSAGQRALGDREPVDPADDIADALAEEEFRRNLVARALEVMRAEFQPMTWKACWDQVVGERSATEIAAELGISVNAVYLAKSRVLRRLRQELEGMLD